MGHNAYEFVLDFGTQEHEGPETRLHTGIVTSPGYAQAFAETLSDALAKYRETYGSIPAEEPRAAKGQ